MQDADEGYRISTVSIDDAGTDLFLLKCKDNAVINTHEIQVKTARTLQKANNTYFGMTRPAKHGMKNKKGYIFLFMLQ